MSNLINNLILSNNIKAVFFDFDGVILDSNDARTEGFRELFRDYNEEIIDKIVKHHIYNGGMSRYEKIKYYFENYINENLSEEKFNLYCNNYGLIVKDEVLKCSFIDGILEFIERYNELDLFIISA